MYYPTDQKFEINIPVEVTEFRTDLETLGMVSDEDNWYVTEAWAEKFTGHLRRLAPLAEKGHVLAQYSVAVIYMFGLCYSNRNIAEESYQKDCLAMSQWLEHAAKQGYMIAVDNLVSVGVGAEAERLRLIVREVILDKESGKTFLPGETWRRAYGSNN